MRFFIPGLLLLLCASSVSAQTELTVEQIQRQSKFIEAKQLALLGRTDRAITAFQEMEKEDGGDDAVLFELGRLHQAKDELNAAVEYLQKAYALRKNDVYATFLAELYEDTGRHRDGAALYAQLRKADPDDELLYLREVEFLVQAQEAKAAIGVLNELEDRIGVNAEIARQKHRLYVGMNDEKRAEKVLLKLVEAQPGQLGHRHLLAGYYVTRGNERAAEKVYREILALEPADVRAQLALQNTSAPAAAQNSGADDLLAMIGRTDVELDLKIGKLLPLLQNVARTQVPGDVQRAVELATELRRVHPDEPKAAALLGDVYFQTGQLSAAADAYKTTLELDDKVYPVWEQLLGTLYLSNRSVELRKYAENALDLYPNRPAVHVHYAIGEAMRANFGEANSLLETAQLMVSTQPDATAALAELAKAFAQLAGANAGSVDLAVLPGGKEGPVAFMLNNAGDLPALQRADTPGNTNALFLEALGDQLAASGDKAAAAKAYTRAKAAGSKSKELASKLSRAGS